jgi:hypothetical protein
LVAPSKLAFGVDSEYVFSMLSANHTAIIIATLSPDVREPTPLESYLCRALAFTLLAFGFLVVILTGSVPMTVALHLLALTLVVVESEDR